MASPNDSVKQMFDVWQQSQDAFMSAQRDFAENIGKSFAQAAGADEIDADADVAETWQAFMKSWTPLWDPSGSLSGLSGAPDSLDFTHLLDPRNWTAHAPEQLRGMLESISHGPEFADLATPQADAAKVWREVLDFQEAAADFSKVLQDAWLRAFSEYSSKHSVDDLKSGKVQEALDRWLKIANSHLLETQRSQPFLDAQKRLLRTGVEVKRRQREQAEAWCAEYQIPTRSEVDDLTHIVHELRAELRAAQRELRNVRSGGKK